MGTNTAACKIVGQAWTRLLDDPHSTSVLSDVMGQFKAALAVAPSGQIAVDISQVHVDLSLADLAVTGGVNADAQLSQAEDDAQKLGTKCEAAGVDMPAYLRKN